MTPAEMVARFRTWKANQPAWRPRPPADFPDDAPEPAGERFPIVLAYGEHRCVCGGSTKKIGSNWWCSNPKYHLSRPAEVDR